MTDLALAPAPRRISLVEKVASRYEVEPEKLLTTLKATCFRTAPDKPAVTNEQMMALLIVADQYNLNPFTKELFAFDDKRGGIIPYVSVDGWARIINEHPQFDGMQFAWDKDEQAMTCTIHRKDRTHPTVVTEYMVECKRATDPWTKTPRRMLRHKSLMQCGRIAFGFAGIYDQDEAERIVEGSLVERVDRPPSTLRAALQRVLHASREHFAQPVTDVQEQQPADADDGAPHQRLEDLMVELEAAEDVDAAGEVLDRARGLPEDEFALLAAIYASAWNQGESR